MKLTIMLKSPDADSLGGEILESLGMTRNISDPKRFYKNLGINEMVNKVDDAMEGDEDGDGEVDASFAGRRPNRRRRHLKSLSDYLFLEDNTLYALPYIEPLTDRGIMPLKVQLITDSTAGMTPIAATVVDHWTNTKSDEDVHECPQCLAAHDNEVTAPYCDEDCKRDSKIGVDNADNVVEKKSAARHFMLDNEDNYDSATELAEATALELSMYVDELDFEIPEWLFEMASTIKHED